MLQKRVNQVDGSLVFSKREFNSLLCDNKSTDLRVVDLVGSLDWYSGSVSMHGILNDPLQKVNVRPFTLSMVLRLGSDNLQLRVSISEDRRN